MNIKELDKIINEVLIDEVKNTIQEQLSDTDHMIDSIKTFQTLSGLTDKIINIENIGTDDFGIIINIELTPEELIESCGGSNFAEAQKNLMQGLHHDLEDNGLGENFDIDIDAQGDQDILQLIIKITANNDELSSSNVEETKDTNPTVDKKKNIILGGENETEKINESMKKRTLKLNETQMKELIKKIINEAAEETMDGITRHARDGSKKQNDDALAAVEKKIRDYLSFNGNDNPEFPNQIGKGGEKEARKNSEDQDQVVDDNRGRGPQDLDYDTDGIDDNGEPAKKFRDRAKKALVGDSTMGNPSDAGNAIKTDVGEKMAKNVERRRENLRKEPIYPKEAVPVKTKPEKEPLRPVNEEDVTKEIERIKQMSFYNNRTQ